MKIQIDLEVELLEKSKLSICQNCDEAISLGRNTPISYSDFFSQQSLKIHGVSILSAKIKEHSFKELIKLSKLRAETEG